MLGSQDDLCSMELVTYKNNYFVTFVSTIPKPSYVQNETWPKTCSSYQKHARTDCLGAPTRVVTCASVDLSENTRYNRGLSRLEMLLVLSSSFRNLLRSWSPVNTASSCITRASHYDMIIP